MSIRGEIPFPEPEYALSPEAVLGFRDQIVFPAVDALSANNIITEAPPGSKAGFEYTIPCPIGTVQLKLVARAWMAPDDDGSMVRQAGCELNMKVIDADITPGTLEVAEIDEEDRNFLYRSQKRVSLLWIRPVRA
ncbi:hypothetical protein KC951_02245 [Candidatus Saccharibacteria bacterium]|nr:hypothetical protein [Candidatus Saccharibacteria bacterium]